MSALRFQPATPADVEAVVALVNSAYRGESSRAGWTTEADILGGQRTDPASLREMLVPDEQGHEQRVELAFDGEKLVGCMYLRREPATLYLGMLTVTPTLQASGLGKQLLAHAEDLARGWGCTRMRMTVIHTRTELLAYYFRRGYALTGASEPFPTDPKYGLPKGIELKLLELVKPL